MITVLAWLLLVSVLLACVSTVVLVGLIAYELWVRYIGPACWEIDRWITRKFGPK